MSGNVIQQLIEAFTVPAGFKGTPEEHAECLQAAAEANKTGVTAGGVRHWVAVGLSAGDIGKAVSMLYPR